MLGGLLVELVVALAVNGLIWGLIIALIALGLSIIFGLLDIINLAHGDFFMVGTVLAWFVVQHTDSFWLALLVVPLIGLVLGAMIQRVIIMPIQNAAALTIVATFGLSIMLQEGVRATFGAAPKRLLPPIETTIPLFGIQYDLYRIVAAAIALTCLIAFFVFLHRTKLGSWMRAVRHDRETAISLGIPVGQIYTITFAIGFGFAALGGVVAAPITTVDFRTGVDILPFCFMAVIIGGLGNLQGTAFAAVLLAFLEGIITAFADPVIARITSLCLMSAVLLFRPQGIFAGATS